MNADGPAPTALDPRVAALLAGRPDWRARRPARTVAVAPLASPTHRATASDCLRVSFETGPALFLKLRHPDMAADILPQAGTAARRAADLGIGPDVVFEDEAALALADLPAPWREARVGDLQDPGLVGRVLDAKKRLHASGPLGARFCPFARIAALAAEARAAGAPLPDGTERLLATTDLVREAVHAAGFDLAFCHNDGIASNVMIREAQECGAADLRLVDFDLAGDNDPWFDVGALLNEACLFEDQRRATIEHYAGSCPEHLYGRCRLYGAVDDVMWGLWGVVRAVTSARTGIEFYKYGTWRLLHARTTLGARECEAWLRRL
ncbi:phosphotransferase family protein [Methylobacterium indicum]|uniref:Aminoglycoside phosphotransferase n=1 Tax=Methylobacterium indicum TaxID=1775910 RepID=A0A8H8WYU9_9HYPH|nr:phosphotransferase [Methylobacterium indicum]BCM87175.1 aminoglycoside phosphotransferase [Methylobacterium indicum]